MSAAPDILASFIKFIAYAPLSVVPVLTWSVFTAVALSLYFYYKPMALDYIFTPITLAFIMYSAFKRDGWGGVAGASLGVLLIPLLNWAGILADASQFFWQVLTYLVASLWRLILFWATWTFITGFVLGLMPFLSVVVGVIAGLMTGLAISGVSMYIAFVTNSIKRFIHRITFRMPPGVTALVALPTAALVMAIEVALAIMITVLALAFSIGFLLASLFLWPVKSFADGAAYLIGLVISQFWHRIEGDAFSPAAWLATAIAYFAKAGTPAMLMAIATAMLLTPRYGKSAYTWMAVALSVHAYFAWVGIV
jgi:hypothetical protein